MVCDPVLRIILLRILGVDYEDQDWAGGLWGREKEIGDSLNIQAGWDAPIIILKTIQNYDTAFYQ